MTTAGSKAVHDSGGNGGARRWRQRRCTTLAATAMDVGDGDDRRRRLEVNQPLQQPSPGILLPLLPREEDLLHHHATVVVQALVYDASGVVFLHGVDLSHRDGVASPPTLESDALVAGTQGSAVGVVEVPTVKLPAQDTHAHHRVNLFKPGEIGPEELLFAKFSLTKFCKPNRKSGSRQRRSSLANR
ncbi:unnamed protein product, partial [Linum tenue]